MDTKNKREPRRGETEMVDEKLQGIKSYVVRKQITKELAFEKLHKFIVEELQIENQLKNLYKNQKEEEEKVKEEIEIKIKLENT
ncbi:unnamed protein product [Cunninghamella echinulata]